MVAYVEMVGVSVISVNVVHLDVIIDVVIVMVPLWRMFLDLQIGSYRHSVAFEARAVILGLLLRILEFGWSCTKGHPPKLLLNSFIYMSGVGEFFDLAIVG